MIKSLKKIGKIHNLLWLGSTIWILGKLRILLFFWGGFYQLFEGKYPLPAVATPKVGINFILGG